MVTIVPRASLQPTSTQVPSGVVPHLIVEHLGDLLLRAEASLIRSRTDDAAFTKEFGYRLPTQETLAAATVRIRDDLSAFANRFPDQVEVFRSFSTALDLITASDRRIQDVAAAYRSALEAYGSGFEPARATPRARVIFSAEGLDAIVRIDHPRHRTAERDYLAAAMELLAFRRDRHEHLTVDERIAVRAAYWLLDQGVHIPGELVAQEADTVPVQRLLDRIQEGEHAVRDADLAIAYAEHRLEGLQGVEH